MNNNLPECAAESTRESGWLIMRHINSDALYWTGHFLDSSRGFNKDHSKAIRFARQHDANIVLSWLLDGVGRVEEHIWGI